MNIPEPSVQKFKGKRFGLQPVHVFLFTKTVLVVLLGIMAIFPKDGLRITDDIVLYFPNIEDVFGQDSTEAPKLEEILANLEEPQAEEKISIVAPVKGDSLASVNVSGRSPKKIQYPNGDLSILYPAFAALEGAAYAGKPVRVMHYGDSQIEGDRMTSLFRAKLQERFGGTGPGLIPAKPLVNSFSVVQEYSETMQRYTMYGVRDTSVHHSRYGAMAIFGRFAPIFPDTALGQNEYTGWISLKSSGSAYGSARVFNTLKVFYGHNRRPFSLKLFVDDVPFAEDSLSTAKGMRLRKYKFSGTPGKLMMIMSGHDSPDIYGLSLEGSSGVCVDNISMRGSSGTFFGGLDQSIFRPMIDSLNVKLLFLQYGGNTVPHIESQEEAVSYGRQFKGQLEYLKKMIPGVSIIVIGPSDMSMKVGIEYQTYPNLPFVRDALRDAAFSAGAAYFDIYEVMGGRNSMVQWVQAAEPLAGNDYVHFNPKGARVIADAFMKSFMEDYELYLKAKVQ